jgi:hypothetical protein
MDDLGRVPRHLPLSGAALGTATGPVMLYRQVRHRVRAMPACGCALRATWLGGLSSRDLAYGFTALRSTELDWPA